MITALYAPAFRHKKAPRVPGHIAWNDTTKQPFHLKWNGKQWTVRPISGTGRVEPGFTTDEPVATFDTLDAAWYYAASGGTQEPVDVHPPTPTELVPVIDSIHPRMKSSRAAATEIAQSGTTETFTVTLEGEGTAGEHQVFTATRTVGKFTVTVNQEYTADESGKPAKTPLTVTVTENADGRDIVIIDHHRLAGEKHGPWFFTNDEESVEKWIATAVRRIRKQKPADAPAAEQEPLTA